MGLDSFLGAVLCMWCAKAGVVRSVGVFSVEQCRLAPWGGSSPAI